MKTFSSTTVLVMTVVGLFGETSFADYRNDLADLAHDLQWQMNRVNRTLNMSFRTGPMAREMSADAREMTLLVEDIHELAEHNGSLKVLTLRAKSLCELVCELKDHAADIRPACGNRFSSGDSSCRFGSRFNSVGPTETEIRFLTNLLLNMESTLEILERELIARTTVPARPIRMILPPTPTVVVPKAMPPIGRSNRGGWSVSFRIN